MADTRVGFDQVQPPAGIVWNPQFAAVVHDTYDSPVKYAEYTPAKPMRNAIPFIAAVFLLSPVPGHAGNAAFLFAYHPKEGQRAQFDAGYRKHLDWHRANRDPLPWYGWYVASGDRTGMFVDGSFGITFEAFDNRVKPAEDGANFGSTTAPYGDTAYRKILRRMPALGTATRLEDREPSPGVEVVTVFVVPGRTAIFESCLQQLVAAESVRDTHGEAWQYRKDLSYLPAADQSPVRAGRRRP